MALYDLHTIQHMTNHLAVRTYHRQEWFLCPIVRRHIITSNSIGNVIHSGVWQLLLLKFVFQTGLSSPAKTTFSAALTQWASKRVPKAIFHPLGYSWLIFYLFDFKLTSLAHILIPVNRLVEALPSVDFEFLFTMCL